MPEKEVRLRNYKENEEWELIRPVLIEKHESYDDNGQNWDVISLNISIKSIHTIVHIFENFYSFYAYDRAFENMQLLNKNFSCSEIRISIQLPTQKKQRTYVTFKWFKGG